MNVALHNQRVSVTSPGINTWLFLRLKRPVWMATYLCWRRAVLSHSLLFSPAWRASRVCFSKLLFEQHSFANRKNSLQPDGNAVSPWWNHSNTACFWNWFFESKLTVRRRLLTYERKQINWEHSKRKRVNLYMYIPIVRYVWKPNFVKGKVHEKYLAVAVCNTTKVWIIQLSFFAQTKVWIF